MGHSPPNHDVGKVMTSLQPQNVFLHLMGCLSINLVVLVIVLLLNGEDILIREEDVFACILGMTLEETLCSCPSDHLQSRRKDVFL